MSDAIIEVTGVTKTFEGGMIPALNAADLRIDSGEFVAIVGPSGCGKSTLLHLIAALDRADSGRICVAGWDLSAHGDLSKFRATQVGIVFQLHNLIATLNASENVQVPLFETAVRAADRRRRADELLDLVGMKGKAHYLPTQLSGGERQRVAIARALANEPPILLADEPTGNLDSAAGELVLALIERLRAERGLTILMVTHDLQVAAKADRIVRMIDGRVVASEPSDGAGRPAKESA